MPELVYAKDRLGRMVHIDAVPNGAACGCVCPGCGEQLIARNNGEVMTPHFAHYGGSTCVIARETSLHLLAKEIVAEEKCIMLPAYGSVLKPLRQRFDSVEVEQRNDVSSLQPDLCGVVHRSDGNDARLWIEIKVTHPIDSAKRATIVKRGIACVEIDLSRFINMQVSKDELRHFITDMPDGREWTNNPVLEQRQRLLAQERRDYAQRMNEELRRQTNGSDNPAYDSATSVNSMKADYLSAHPDTWVQPSHLCMTCRHHTTRAAITDEIKRRHLPSWLHEALDCNLRWMTHDNMPGMMEHRGEYHFYHERYNRALPTQSPDSRGRTVSDREIRQNSAVIPFLLNTVPDIISASGMRCKHCVHTFPTLSTKYDIACNHPNVVNKHRRKKPK